MTLVKALIALGVIIALFALVLLVSMTVYEQVRKRRETAAVQQVRERRASARWQADDTATTDDGRAQMRIVLVAPDVAEPYGVHDVGEPYAVGDALAWAELWGEAYALATTLNGRIEQKGS